MFCIKRAATLKINQKLVITNVNLDTALWRVQIGHRSQAPEKIRFIMGRNLPDFIRFIRAHSDVFSYDPVSDTIKLVNSWWNNDRKSS